MLCVIHEWESRKCHTFDLLFRKLLVELLNSIYMGCIYFFILYFYKPSYNITREEKKSFYEAYNDFVESVREVVIQLVSTAN